MNSNKNASRRRILLKVSIIIQLCTLSSAYTAAVLERLAQASSLSYLPSDRMAASPYSEPSSLRPLAQVLDPASESGATIFEDAVDPSLPLVVACRGSANPKNFGTNLKFDLVPATRLSQTSVPDDARIHRGFQDAAAGLWGALAPRLYATLEERAGASGLVFTGHSLGAATALLCAVHYTAARRGKDGYVRPDVITFGGPKLCNGALARHLRNEALEGSNVLHLVHGKDPVLANNQKLWKKLGFEDVGVEMQCDPKSPMVYTVEDPPKKSRSFLGRFAWNIVDHCNYMGVFVGPRL